MKNSNEDILFLLVFMLYTMHLADSVTVPWLEIVIRLIGGIGGLIAGLKMGKRLYLYKHPNTDDY